MGPIGVFVYGLVAYVAFLSVFLYAIGFVGNFGVPKGVDSGAVGPVSGALAVNVLLIALFGVQHSVMARPWFKHWWTRWVPRPAERSTFVMATNLVLAALFWLWEPMPAPVWRVEAPSHLALEALFWAGWLIALLATFQIDHFDLFGLRQVYFHLLGRAYTPPPFRRAPLYRVVRHPLMLGLLLGFWATPAMSQGHLLFAAGMTAYVLVGVFFEERDLVRAHPESYGTYRSEVPMLLPRLGRSKHEGS